MREGIYGKLLLVSILFVGILVRFYGFTNPIADWHSWRQADTSAVSRNFVTNGFDVLQPIFDDLSNVPSGQDNPRGLRFVEFPIYNIAQAGVHILFQFLNIEQAGRLVTIFSSVLSGLFLFLLVKKYLDERAALFTVFFYLFIPFNIYYGRSILPDPTMVMTILGGIYFFSVWEKSNFKFSILHLPFLLTVLFVSAAFLLKPYALFFTLPMVWIVYRKHGWSFIKKWQLWIFALITITPFILWRLWMLQYPEGIPANDWLFNAGNIRFKGAYFYWIFADRIGRLILGYWGIALFVIGLLTAGKKNAGFFISFLIASLLYVVVIARGNVQHDYYQILIVPTIAIFLGIGASFLMSPIKEFTNKKVSIVVLGICSLFTLLFGWYFVRDFYNINNQAIVEAGSKLDTIAPKNAKVLALYGGDTTFLYQTKRQGWASYQKSLPEMIGLGAEYLTQIDPPENDIALYKRDYTIVASTSSYVIVKLKN